MKVVSNHLIQNQKKETYTKNPTSIHAILPEKTSILG